MPQLSAAAEETYSSANPEDLARVYNFIEAREVTGRGRPTPRYLLAGAEPGDQVELPEEVYRILRQVIQAMREGLSVTVSPVSQTLTTQQAADILGMSRPTLVRLLDRGEIPFERVNSRRSTKLSDVLNYRTRRREKQYEALEAMPYVDENTPLPEVLAQLKEARHAVAARRRAATSGS